MQAGFPLSPLGLRENDSPPMLPNARHAWIPPDKVSDYLLSHTHPVGASTSRLFAAHGYGHSKISSGAGFDENGLVEGDVGAVVHRYQGVDAFEVELVRGDGTTTAVVTGNAKDIRPILDAEILHVRQVAA